MLSTKCLVKWPLLRKLLSNAYTLILDNFCNKSCKILTSIVGIAKNLAAKSPAALKGEEKKSKDIKTPKANETKTKKKTPKESEPEVVVDDAKAKRFFVYK